MSELKPCPFCGSSARFIVWAESADPAIIACNGEHCDVAIDADYETDETKEGFVARWNSRPVEDKLRADLAKAEDFIVRVSICAGRVMSLLAADGESIVAHLNDSDDNEGERLRALVEESVKFPAVRRALAEEET